MTIRINHVRIPAFRPTLKVDGVVKYLIAGDLCEPEVWAILLPVTPVARRAAFRRNLTKNRVFFEKQQRGMSK